MGKEYYSLPLSSTRSFKSKLSTLMQGYKFTGVQFLKRSTSSMLMFVVLGSVLVALSNNAAAQCILLNDDFSTAPTLSSTSVPGAWYPDRYAPAAFTNDAGRLKISISAADGAQLRPSGFSGGFYNTQGRKFDQCGCVTVAKADLYIPADWATKIRRTDMWATAFDASNSISFYPIIGFRNVDGLSPNLSYWDGSAWSNLGAPSAYDTWYTLEIRLVGANLEYLVNNVVVATIASNGSVHLGDVMMQAYNFNDNTLGVSYDNSVNNSYDAFWDNLSTSYGVGKSVTNTTTNLTYCTIQAAIDDPLTTNGHTLVATAGTYSETITVNKDLIIQGPNVGIAGNAVRVAEAIISDGKVDILGNNTVVFDGFKIYQTNTTTPISLGGGAIATIQNNIIERFGVATGSTVRGIEISSGAGAKTIANNLITGDVSGGLYGGHKTWNSGMYINAAGSAVALTNNVIENCRTAMNIDDMSVGVNLSNNTFDNNGTHISFGGLTPTSGSYTFGANDFKAPGSAYFNLSNVAASFRLDVSAGSLDGTAFSSVPLATLFLVELGTYHRGRYGRNGRVTYVPNNLYVVNYTGTGGPIIDDIATAISYADAGDILNLENGTYNQRVVIDKSLTLDGQSETGVILDGSSGVTGTGSGIFINSNVTNVTIEDLTVQNFAGSSGNSNAGIYANLSNNNLTVQNVTIQNNVGGSGFYANGPVNTVLIDNVTSSGHTTGARGIVIWNGLKENITITNCEVFNNNCCGIELQDGTSSGVTISNNNVYNNGDNGLGLSGMQGPGENVISGNTVTNNGRFGIEVKNPNGSGLATGAGRIVVENNNVSRTVAITDLRDIVGIAVFRRGVLAGNVDVPNGVVVQTNTVSGYVQTSTSDGFGIVIEGTNSSALTNTISGNDVGLQLQSGHLPYPGDGNQNNVADDYFGRGNSPITCGIEVSGNIFSGNGVDERNVPASAASGIVTIGSTIYCSIQAAIDAANPLDVINVSAGTFDENVIINKALTINGPNAGQDCSTRVGAEAIIAPTAGVPVIITADGVTLNGFEITAPDAYNAVILSDRSNVSVSYNNIHNIGTNITGVGTQNIHAIVNQLGTTNSSNVTISNNCIEDIGTTTFSNQSLSAIGILQSSSTGVLSGLDIEDNTINNLNVNTASWPAGKIAYGIQINVGGGGSYLSTSGKVVNASISGNSISNLAGFISTGIALEGNTENAIVDGNSVSNLTAYKLAARSGGGYDLNGLKFENNRYVGTVTVANNVFAANTFIYNVTPNLGYAVANYVPLSPGVSAASLGCNWYGSANYGDLADNPTLTGKIFNKEGAATSFVPYSSDAALSSCPAATAIPSSLTVTYNATSENIVVNFDLDDNSAVIAPIPGLDPNVPADLAAITAKYVALQLAIATGTPADIKTAALDLGDDIITEYYYLDAGNPVYLQTAGGNELIKQKYWDLYLNNTTTTVQYPDYTAGTFEVPIGTYSTSTNPATGAVNSGWLAPVYGKDLYVRVTVVHNGSVNIVTQTVAIGAASIVNVNTGLGYPSIQSANDAAATMDGHVITVAAGTYAENAIITKELDIRGPNYGNSPNAAPARVAEAIFVPATTESDAIFIIEADNVKINGLTIDGDNTAITTGWTGTNGADIDVYDGIGIYDANNVISVSDVKIENNIFKNLAYFGVDNFGWYNYANPATSGHLVKDNLFQDLGTYSAVPAGAAYWGGGVLIYNDNYTHIVDNVMTNVRIGIQTGNFHDANPGTADYQVIDNNTIQARRRGIFYNLHTGPSVAPLTISNNTITGLANGNETQWDGILAASLSDAVGIISGNSVDGAGLSIATQGFEAWNVNSSVPVEFLGGIAKNVDIGIFVNNYEGYASNAGNTATIIDGVDLTVGVGVGVHVYDSPSNTNNATVAAIIRNNTEITTNTTDGIGILVEGADASATIDDNLATIEGNDIGIKVSAGTATITNNTIKLNNTGILFENSGTGSATSNNIFDNVNYGIENTTGASITATGNWWGDATGPAGAGPGLGDVISVDVDACPWLDNVVGTGVSTSPIFNFTQSTYHCSIQDAITAATAGDEIQILSPDYTEPGQIVVDKDILLKGLGIANTTLRPGVNTANSGDARGFILVNASVTFDLEDLTIDGTGKLVYQAIRQRGDGSINNVKFTEIKYNESGPDYSGVAVAAFGTGDVDITNCDFSEIGRVGVLYFGTGITGSTFSSNTYTGKGTGNWLDYALDINAGAIVTVSNNTISNNTGVATSDGSTSAGILVTTYSGAGTAATITGNTISNNTSGIAVGYDASDLSTVTATGNDFSGNEFGVTTTAPIVDATSNYWGAADGPSGVGSGSGDAIVAGVDACPYYDAPVATGTLVSCPIKNITSGEYFYYIQDAIDDPDTDPNDQISVASGSYSGNVNITKSLDIRGANYGVACTGTRGVESELNGAGTTVTISANDVSIDGFTITGDVAVSNVGFNNMVIQNNIIEANETGIYTVSTQGSNMQDNCITLSNQTYAIQEFATNPTLSVTQAAATWYTDRYAPAGFVSASFDGDLRLKHSITAATQQPGAFQNTQGRKYDTDNATSASIELYVPASWATSGERMAGFWGTGFDAGNAVSLYPIIEFSSDGAPANPRFRVYNNGVWIDMGLPTGFTYNSWVDLSMTIVNDEVVYAIGDLSVSIPANSTTHIGNVILQGHNFAVGGATYDIYWDNLKIYGGVPTEANRQTTGIFLSGASGANALTVLDNNVSDAFYGYLMHNVNTTAQTAIDGGTIQGVMQGVAVLNTLDFSTYQSSSLGVKNVSMSLFAGDYTGNAAFVPTNFHAGVYSFTSGATTPATGITLDIEDCTIDGTGTPAQNSGGVEIADFSTGGATAQTVNVSGSTISNNANRGVDVRGYVDATLTDNVLSGNGNAAWGLSGNDGYTILARSGASIDASLNFITHPATSTTNVIALQTGNAPNSSINAYNNSILMNGNASAFGAVTGSGDIMATCNWWGAASGPASSLFSGTVTYIPWLISNDLSTPDCTGGRVYNVNTATYYPDIQPAINAATTLNGHVLEVMPGDYFGNSVNGNIGVTKQLEIRGANYNVDPNTGVRGSESVVDGTFTILNDNITIDGFQMVGDSASLRNDQTALPATLGSTFSGLTFSNNLVTNKSGTQEIVLLEKTLAQSTMATANWSIVNNRFVDFEGTGSWVISLSGITTVDITDNVIMYNNEDANTTNPILDRKGIRLEGCGTVDLSSNTIDMGSALTVGMTEAQRDVEFDKAPYAIELVGISTATLGTSILDNVILGAKSAISSSGSGMIENLTITGNTISDVNYGLSLLPNNAETIAHKGILVESNDLTTFKECLFFGAGTSGSYEDLQIIKNSLINTLPNYAIQVNVVSLIGASTDAIATCNWYGTADYSIVASKHIGPIDFSQYATDSDLSNLQCGLAIQVAAYLEGPFDVANHVMKNDLNLAAPSNILGTYATSQPYNVAPWNYAGTESVSPTFLATHDSIVDWVLIELRDPTNITTVLHRAAGFICEKGAVIGTDGGPIRFETGGDNDFHIALRHRNHADVATAVSVPGKWDIRYSSANVYGGSSSLKLVNLGDYVLYGGDGDGNNAINTNDIAPILLNFFNNGYFNGDYLMTGFINGSDINPVNANFFITISFP